MDSEITLRIVNWSGGDWDETKWRSCYAQKRLHNAKPGNHLNRQALKCREESGHHTWRTPTLSVSKNKLHPWFFSWSFTVILCYYHAVSKFACKTLALDSLFVDILTYVIKTLLCTSAWRLPKSRGRRDDVSKFLWLETKKHCQKSLGHKT